MTPVVDVSIDFVYYEYSVTSWCYIHILQSRSRIIKGKSCYWTHLRASWEHILFPLICLEAPLTWMLMLLIEFVVLLNLEFGMHHHTTQALKAISIVLWYVWQNTNQLTLEKNIEILCVVFCNCLVDKWRYTVYMSIGFFTLGFNRILSDIWQVYMLCIHCF